MHHTTFLKLRHKSNLKEDNLENGTEFNNQTYLRLNCNHKKYLYRSNMARTNDLIILSLLPQNITMFYLTENIYTYIASKKETFNHSSFLL